jgi:putative flippase GtrA
MSNLVRRWVAFNGVGALGIGVQLGLLAALVRLADLHYLLATAIAVELTVLHNFAWHEWWTWRERRAGTPARLAARLLRFHLLNGAVSMSGNLIVMRLLAGRSGVDPVAANIVAILLCSALNFAASELIVFKAAVTTALLFGTVTTATAAEPFVTLKPATVAAWQAYERQLDARYQAADPFFALDAFGAGAWRDAARRGEVPMRRIEKADPRGGEQDIADGKIHHWAGAIFIPHATVEQVLKHLAGLAGNEAGRYEDVVASRLMSRDGDRFRIFMKLRRASVITVTYNTEHEVEYRRIGSTRASGRSVATKIAELADAGTPREREKPPGDDHGFLWRLNAYWRYEAVDGGVLIECESATLSRGVPTLLKPFIGGTVERLARESLHKTLTGLKNSLTARS